VRQTEALVNRLLTEESGEKKALYIDPDIKQLEQRLSDQLGSKVAIQHGVKGKGKMVINYNSTEELEGILSHIK
ncbi:MAG: chromosome partitioning protein ParB, partial [Pseudomonadales bacterium]|nr:chromosome partitioning protein ParB [Pseudomonadales bacterium]